MSKHTPGPWRVVTEEGRPVVKCANDFYITNTVDAAGYESDDDTMFANARLIAAAPDLLEALLTALPYVEDVLADKAQLACFKPGIVERHAAQIRAAIFSATGEQ